MNVEADSYNVVVERTSVSNVTSFLSTLHVRNMCFRDSRKRDVPIAFLIEDVFGLSTTGHVLSADRLGLQAVMSYSYRYGDVFRLPDGLSSCRLFPRSSLTSMVALVISTVRVYVYLCNV